uniref:Uncharacterized protein n=1 Tax=Drosophila-associated filamentous virus TaxID=2743186 RepID=A0A6M9U0M7_9VIRU|nr:putative protein 37 [Drosophila-associated filamentous virus]
MDDRFNIRKIISDKKNFIDLTQMIDILVNDYKQIGQESAAAAAEPMKKDYDTNSANDPSQRSNFLNASFLYGLKQSWQTFFKFNISTLMSMLEQKYIQIISHFIIKELQYIYGSSVTICEIDVNIVNNCLPIYIHENDNNLFIFINKKYLFYFLEDVHAFFILIKYNDWIIKRPVNRNEQVNENVNIFNNNLMKIVKRARRSTTTKHEDDNDDNDDLLHDNLSRTQHLLNEIFHEILGRDNLERSTISIILVLYHLIIKSVQIYYSVHKLKVKNVVMDLPTIYVKIKQPNQQQQQPNAASACTVNVKKSESTVFSLNYSN